MWRFLRGWRTRRLMRLGVVDEIAQRADAVGLAHDMGMHAEVHEAAAGGAFRVEWRNISKNFCVASTLPQIYTASSL